FFQAEDGIRDRTVTGVQTCALPISWSTPPRPLARNLPTIRNCNSTSRGSMGPTKITAGWWRSRQALNTGWNLATISCTSSATTRSEEHTSELQSPYDLVCRLLLEKK